MPARRPLRLNQLRSLATILALLVAWGCRGKSDERDDPGDQSEATAESETSSAAGGMQMMSALLKAGADEPGPYDEPESSEGASDSTPHVAVVELAGEITELRGFSWLGGFAGLELRAVVDRLHQLAADSNVEALVLRMTDLAIGLAHAEELRAEIEAIRAARPDFQIACFAESAGPVLYYLMTACSEIAVAEGGQLSIPGVAAVPIHIKGLLDRAGITADFIHIGAYKGAAEPLTRDAPSAQARETTAMILDRAYQTLVAGIAKGRSLPAEQVEAAIDRAVLGAEAAREARLIDKVAQFEAYRDALAGDRPWRSVEIGEDKNPTQQLLELIGMSPVRRPTGDRVALVYAVGNVVDGEGQGIAGARGEIASRTLVPALRALAADDQVKAVVLRIDSPGGSALASEIIWNAVARLGEKKPVIVSMASVAASGGYYIAAGAKTIFALDNTLTGSIGVVGGKLALSGAMKKLGVSVHPVGRGEHALLFASPEPWTPAQREIVRRSMTEVYDRFASRVRAGRGDIGDELMQGRVWTGAAARDNKLVDARGGLRAALAEARKLGGVGADSEIEVYPPAPTLKDLLGSFGVSSGERLLSAALREAAAALSPLLAQKLFETAALATGFIDAPIQAAAFLPAVVE